MSEDKDLTFQFYLNSDDESIIKLRNFLWIKINSELFYKSKTKMRTALRYILINAIVSYRIGQKIHYSRANDKVYQMPDWYSHTAMLSQIDWLVCNDYLDHELGKHFDEKQSTFSPTEKLIKLFVDFKIQPEKMVFNRDDKALVEMKEPNRYFANGKRDKTFKPKSIPFRVSPPVRKIRNFLEVYNDFIQQQSITGVILSKDKVKIKHYRRLAEMEVFGRGMIDQLEFYEEPFKQVAQYQDKLNPLYLDILIESYILDNHKKRYQDTAIINNKYLDRIYNSNTNNTTTYRMYVGRYGIKHSHTNGLLENTNRAKYLFLEMVFAMRRRFLNSYEDLNKGQRFQQKINNHTIYESVLEPYLLKIDTINFTLYHNTLRRVFNNNDWKQGGRFYDATHINLGGAIRNSLLINGEPVVEPDFSGLHIRMLYNRLGIDFRDECYVYRKGENDTERERMKLLSLIAINSREEEARGAIINNWKMDNIYPNHEPNAVQKRMDQFREYHKPIQQFLFAGVGIELQYLDSVIMENILRRCLQLGVPALPVHDSVIVPRSFGDEIVIIMKEEYQKVLGFEPVI